MTQDGVCAGCGGVCLVNDQGTIALHYDSLGQACIGTDRPPAPEGVASNSLPTSGIDRPLAPIRRESRRLVLLSCLAVLLMRGAAKAWSSHQERQTASAAAAAAEESEVEFCNNMHEELSSYITPSGVKPLGREWAQSTLDGWPAEYETSCEHERELLADIVSGEVDRRLASSSDQAREPATPDLSATAAPEGAQLPVEDQLLGLSVAWSLRSASDRALMCAAWRSDPQRALAGMMAGVTRLDAEVVTSFLRDTCG